MTARKLGKTNVNMYLLMLYRNKNILCILWFEITSYNKLLKSDRIYNSISNGLCRRNDEHSLRQLLKALIWGIKKNEERKHVEKGEEKRKI